MTNICIIYASFEISGQNKVVANGVRVGMKQKKKLCSSFLSYCHIKRLLTPVKKITYAG